MRTGPTASYRTSSRHGCTTAPSAPPRVAGGSAGRWPPRAAPARGCPCSSSCTAGGRTTRRCSGGAGWRWTASSPTPYDAACRRSRSPAWTAARPTGTTGRAGTGRRRWWSRSLLPRLERQGLDTTRLALTGWSMGGFGALHLADVLGADRVRAVAAMSPALWHSYDDTAPGAYDDAADFRRTTVLGRQDGLAGIAVRVDCGKGDPFYATTRDYVAGFEHPPAGGFERGDHDSGYWRRIAPRVLRFVGEALGR
ncbi:hypothetical protein G5V59_20195 [Nocardioides sp. W3-2-3]|nr:hypothetical protein [Nocardioides convexus]